MAAKSTRKKKTTGRKTSKKQANTSLRDEVIILAVLAGCILMMLSNFGLGGIAGEAVSSFLFGIFGILAYGIPLFLFGAVAFGVSNKGNAHAYIKEAAVVVLILMLSTFFELVLKPYEAGNSVLSYYTYASQHRTAGGLLGGLLVKLLCPLIGVAGTYVVIIILGVICGILITEKSLLAPIGRRSRAAYDDVRKHQEAAAQKRAKQRETRRIQAEAVKEEAQKAQNDTEKRSDRKVSGVSFATTLTGQGAEEIPEGKASGKKRRRAGKTPDVRELSVSELPEEEMPLPSPFEEFVINRSGSEEESEPKQPSWTDTTENAQSRSEEFAKEQTEERTDRRTQEQTEGQGAVSGGSSFETEPEVETAGQTDAPASRRKSKERQAAVEAEAAHVEQSIKAQEVKPKRVYRIPPVNLLTKGKKGGGDSDAVLRATAQKLEQTLQNFGVRVHVTNASCGPSVTRYELQPEQGVKVSKIVGLSDDIKLNLAAADIRIEAPIPGKAAVGIEVPNQENVAVMLRDLLESNEFKQSKASIPFAVGKDISGKVMVADIARMPHLLVAGATGSGKSVCINTLIMSILYHADPDEVKLIMVDPKVVELSVYNGIPHLLIPVVTDPKKAAGALNWAVAEMTKRYQLFAEYNVRDLKGYNEKVEQLGEQEGLPKKLPKIIIIVDELADLMMVAPGEVEGAICRLAQLARAAGLHLIIATQRPSVNVITGLIKANMPSRIAFSVSSGVDSRTIIDMNGAEKLLGKGDMLFYPSGYPKPVRVQGSFVSDKEVQKVVDYLIEKNGNVSYSEEIEEHVNSDIPVPIPGASGAASESGNDRDAYFADAGRLIIDKEKASIGMLQRMFKIGFNRAARIMDQLAEAGVVGEEEGTKPRKVLMTKEEFEQYVQENL